MGGYFLLLVTPGGSIKNPKIFLRIPTYFKDWPAWSLARLGPWPGLVPVRLGPWSRSHGPWSHGPWSWSLVHGPWSMVPEVHPRQSAPYESYGSIQTTIRRRISIRIILDGSGVKLKPSWHQKLKKPLKVFHRKYQNSERIGSRWLRRGPYPVRMKRNTSGNLSKPLPDHWEHQKIKKILIFRENPDNPGIPYIPYIPYIFPYYSRSVGHEISA